MEYRKLPVELETTASIVNILGVPKNHEPTERPALILRNLSKKQLFKSSCTAGTTRKYF